MARFARCKADAVSVYAGDRSRVIGQGAFVDLEDVIHPAVPAQGDEPAQPAVTLRDVVRLDGFEVFDVDTMEAAMAEATRRDAAAAAATMTATDTTDASETSPASTTNGGSDAEPTSTGGRRQVRR